MDRFVNRQNIERYRKLKEARNAAERRQIMRLLAEERAKFKLEFRSVDPPRARGQRSAAQAKGRRANHSGVAAPRHEPAMADLSGS
jgi:hypothetical protein